MNKDILNALGFEEQVKLVESGCCPFCGHKVKPDEFRDELSKREFKLYGMCQVCQDKTFKEDDDEQS